MNNQVDEDHLKWIDAFEIWFYFADRDGIYANLRNGVSLSSKNSMFLSAVLDGSIKPQSGRASSSAMFESACLDSVIRDCLNQSMPRKEILSELEKAGWLPKTGTLAALDKRITRMSKSPAQNGKPKQEFIAIYEHTTANIGQ